MSRLVSAEELEDSPAAGRKSAQVKTLIAFAAATIILAVVGAVCAHDTAVPHTSQMSTSHPTIRHSHGPSAASPKAAARTTARTTARTLIGREKQRLRNKLQEAQCTESERVLQGLFRLFAMQVHCHTDRIYMGISWEFC